MADAALRNRLVGCVGTACAIALLTFTPHFEGTVLQTYVDPVGIVTACNGHTGPELKLGQKFTKEQCDDMLVADLIKHAEPVLKCTPTLQDKHYKLAAAVDLAFRVGVNKYCSSTIAKMNNAGQDVAACAQYSLWNKMGGRVQKGPSRRAAFERALCEGRLDDAKKLAG